MLLIGTTFLILLFRCECFNQYTKEFNLPSDFQNYGSYEKPFRMQKLNLLWEKAQKKIPEQKLKLLYSDLKFQDKEELAWKRLKTEGLDKNGLKEALVRESFKGILNKYGLTNEFEAPNADSSTPYGATESNIYGQFSGGFPYKIVYRDKKLNKLWLKAEQAGFTDEQLKTLKEEFQHHQDKIDQYYQLMDQVNRGSWSPGQPDNTIEHFLHAEEGEKPLWKSVPNPHQVLREKHTELKLGYDYLAGHVISNLQKKDFTEPPAIRLWEMAQKSDFSPAELHSLRGELHHFEHRIRKLKHLSEMGGNYFDDNYVGYDPYKYQKKLQEYNYKVDKIHRELASRIMQRHSEL